MNLVSGGSGITFGVRPNGDLFYFKYTGDGQNVPSGATGFAPNSGNQIGNGFNNFTRLFGGGDGVSSASTQTGICFILNTQVTGRVSPPGPPALLQIPETKSEPVSTTLPLLLAGATEYSLASTQTGICFILNTQVTGRTSEPP